MNKKIVSGTIALLLSTGALFATENSMVKEVDEMKEPDQRFSLRLKNLTTF